MAKQETVILTKKDKPLAAVKDLSGTDWESVALATIPSSLPSLRRLAFLSQIRFNLAR